MGMTVIPINAKERKTEDETVLIRDVIHQGYSESVCRYLFFVEKGSYGEDAEKKYE